MKKSVLILSTFMCLCHFSVAIAHDASRQVNKLFRQAVKAESIPGLSVAVADHSGMWARGFGYADLEHKVPMTSKTKLRIGSVAKVFTAAALMRLYEQGYVDFNADIREAVPQWPARHAEITLSDLVSHTSGIRHYVSLEEFYSNVEYASTLDALNIFKDDDLLFTPGTDIKYSTYAWTLISAAMESVVEGKNFKQIMAEEVFTPLNMADTDFDDNGPIIAHRQRAYSYINGELINSPEVNASYKYAGGGMLSTPTDVVTFAMAHINKGFLTSDSLAMLFEEKILVDNIATGVGIGWFIGFGQYLEALEQDNGEKNKGYSDLLRIMNEHPHSVMHSGGSVGGESMLILCLEHEHAVAVVKNVDSSPDADTFSLALRSLDAFY
ncbi:serine hydrolase [uncultured Shewanella sp.]|uniref:serine hydrolase domain-containing protein n=1 Tax=uncultured Shewanella sp. TaxID=173975 RepID=UPI002635C41E|nr:serine hydrolase domain-containing protein [uncultured Shewanella sp.]